MKVFIADSNVIVREGLKAIVSEVSNAVIIGESENSGELIAMLVDSNPDILFINYASALMLESDIELIINTMPGTKIIGITERPDRVSVLKYIKNNIDGHLLYSCDKEEIKECMVSVRRNERFFCGKVLEVMNFENNQKSFTCEGVKLSKRELEVIEFVAKGLSNKEIAIEMFLSVHTILTHRKNLMSKLGLRNTAGLVVYAVQNGIHTNLNYVSN
ncbi:MAG: DNA-binding NarL/FixJ family response regulator [Salibacteraceae bacterium]|jgi:DNA-binding NarL/FixJ family response regulator